MLEFIRVATREQIELATELAEEIWSEHYTPIIGAEQVKYMLENFQSIKAITDQIDRGSWGYFLIYHDAEAVGYFAYQFRVDHLFLSKLYLRHCLRGKGISRKVMHFLENVAADNCLKKISLTVNKNNENAIAVYKKLGFSTTGPTVADIGGGYVMDDYIMEKSLSS
ncbi:MAG: GNAT family N-acetyltransferase [Candidatus Riflebacteria bacterium]